MIDAGTTFLILIAGLGFLVGAIKLIAIAYLMIKDDIETIKRGGW